MQFSGSGGLLASSSNLALAKNRATTANDTTTGSAAGSSTVGSKSAKDEFLDYAKLSPAQKMRAAMLSKLKVTEEELRAMPDKERQKIEDQIKELIKQQVLGAENGKIQRGALVDLRA